ncbi:MAG: hypothetical protein IKX22_06100 [Prevotella sp.]|nr:hypothetical protein [Prevotella sp.]
MIFSKKIIQLLQQKCGHDVRTPYDIQCLALDIESQTGEHIGVNTLKRLLGSIDDERSPRISTLDVVARYLGYGDWDTLSQLDTGSNSSFDTIDGELRMADLSVGQQVLITYLPNRHVCMEYLGDGHFRVIEAENSKLLVGDMLSISHIVNNYPLFVTNVLRENADLGSFTAGKAQGITWTLC